MQNSNFKIENPKSKIHGIGNLEFGIWNSSRDGFTLLELTISITLIGIIVLIVTGATRLGFRSVDSGEKKIEALERLRSSLNIIDSQIQSETPLTYSDDNGDRKYYFKGDSETMQFTTNYSVWSGQMGYVLVTYRIASNGYGKQVLYVSENSIGIDNKREAKLLDTFNEIYFEYFYKDPTEEQGSWVRQWTDETSIPEKVKLHLIEGIKDLSMIIPMRSKGSLAPSIQSQLPTSIQAPSPIQRTPGGATSPRGL